MRLYKQLIKQLLKKQNINFNPTSLTSSSCVSAWLASHRQPVYSDRFCLISQLSHICYMDTNRLLWFWMKGHVVQRFHKLIHYMCVSVWVSKDQCEDNMERPKRNSTSFYCSIISLPPQLNREKTSYCTVCGGVCVSLKWYLWDGFSILDETFFGISRWRGMNRSLHRL